MQSERTEQPQKRVLLVDDCIDSVALFEVLLKRCGLECTIAHDGLEGLSMYCDGTYDLVITNINMPGMLGLELVDIVRLLEPRQPILVESAGGECYFDALSRRYPKRLLTLLKPFKVEDFIESIIELIGHADTRGR